MKIQTATNTNITTFENIKAGEVFLYNNEYFMRLDEDCSHYIWGDEELNAVNLNSNKLEGFDYRNKVTRVNGTFVIEK